MGCDCSKKNTTTKQITKPSRVRTMQTAKSGTTVRKIIRRIHK